MKFLRAVILIIKQAGNPVYLSYQSYLYSHVCSRVFRQPLRGRRGNESPGRRLLWHLSTKSDGPSPRSPQCLLLLRTHSLSTCSRIINPLFTPNLSPSNPLHLLGFFIPTPSAFDNKPTLNTHCVTANSSPFLDLSLDSHHLSLQCQPSRCAKSCRRGAATAASPSRISLLYAGTSCCWPAAR